MSEREACHAGSTANQPDYKDNGLGASGSGFEEDRLPDEVAFHA